LESTFNFDRNGRSICVGTRSDGGVVAGEDERLFGNGQPELLGQLAPPNGSFSSRQEWLEWSSSRTRRAET
jgi:hypothetical protein